MPVVASITVVRLREVFEKLGFFPRSDDTDTFERPEDHLMFFPDVRHGKVILIDIFQSIEAWQVDEPLAERFLEALMEMGGLYE
jgi:hypothetical protein